MINSDLKSEVVHSDKYKRSLERSHTKYDDLNIALFMIRL